ncbi:MAG: aldehyde dehydrogenase family protein [Chthoniobacterales bacterium]|nr:aldehyde dehydrogenase family protein [Chthoniobacterales bacterium]
MKPAPFLLGDSEVATGEILEVANPYDGSVAARVCMAGPREIEEALALAHKTFFTTRHVGAEERAALLLKISRCIARCADEFAEIIVSEAGKPVSLARAEVQRAVTTFAAAADAAREPCTFDIHMEATAAGAGHHGTARRFPLGVVLGITPFNFPLNLVAHKIAPCIAAGNTMLLKPSPRAPSAALRLAGVLRECGVPPGQINVLPFDHGRVAGLLGDARIKMLSFTGSADVGWQLKAKAVKKRVTLELGGNAACIVEPDPDWKSHVEKIAAGAFAYAGQSCISVQRIFVHERIYDGFKHELLARLPESAPAGDPRDPHTVVGPMITGGALELALERIADAQAHGARMLTPLRVEGQVLHPVVLENVPTDSAIWCEEAFAPVAALRAYGDFAEALSATNESRFGLQAGVFTKDEAKIARAYDELEAGAVLVNQVPTFRTENMPYGGVKDSGCGLEGVRYAMEEMTALKSLVVNEGGKRRTC